MDPGLRRRGGRVERRRGRERTRRGSADRQLRSGPAGPRRPRRTPDWRRPRPRGVRACGGECASARSALRIEGLGSGRGGRQVRRSSTRALGESRSRPRTPARCHGARGAGARAEFRNPGTGGGRRLRLGEYDRRVATSCSCPSLRETASCRFSRRPGRRDPRVWSNLVRPCESPRRPAPLRLPNGLRLHRGALPSTEEASSRGCRATRPAEAAALIEPKRRLIGSGGLRTSGAPAVARPRPCRWRPRQAARRPPNGREVMRCPARPARHERDRVAQRL